MSLPDPLIDSAGPQTGRVLAPADLSALLGVDAPAAGHPRIAIVGAGPTGLYTLRHLVADARHPLHIDLFERGPVAGPGMPYAEASGTPDLLANIAGRELPPVTETLHGWLNRQPPEVLAGIGIEAPDVSAYDFVPRVAIGAYFTAQFAKVVAQARARGHRVELHRHHHVCDVAPGSGALTLLWEAPAGPGEGRYDEVILATGHQWRDTALEGGVTALSPWPAERLGRLPADRICILGSALSALDAVVAIACARGDFVEEGNGLAYKASPGRAGFHVTLASRKGLLPEADYWYDLPLPDLPRLAEVRPGPALFARAYKALLQDLAEADPACADRLGGPEVTPEALSQAWFAPRLSADPFDWAARNLIEAEASCAAHRAEAWRSVFLRAHELFEELLPHFSDADLECFHVTLRGVFADNYASVPHLSIRRLLALNKSGHLEVVALGADAAIQPAPRGCIAVTPTEGPALQPFEVLIDARGQTGMAIEDLGFPSLAATLPRLSKARFDRYDFAFAGGGRVHCLALPLLLRRHPFVQGLVNAEEMGRATAGCILSTAEARQCA